MSISEQTGKTPLSLKVFAIWLFLTAVPLLLIGIDRLASGVDHYSHQPQWLIFSAFYLSAPIGGPVFSAFDHMAIPVSVTSMTTSILVMKKYRAAYVAALALLVVGVATHFLLFLWPSLLYALLANGGWIWILRMDRIKACFTR